ncbi:MAG TPA: lysophospholipid acyltransferase family protein [Actinomycetota bacterium]|nr:lysophospholipid acyltransferase family protein [Actinomycetota bacterium]
MGEGYKPFYWTMKYVVLGPLLRGVYRPRAVGVENIPATGPVILASNHVSFVDSLFMPLMCPRPVVFLGKADYFESWRTRWFFDALNVIPVRREGGSASEAAILAGIRALKRGHVIGIYPEGTRSPDGRLYRGKTGVARMALEAQAPVVPIAVEGTDVVMPLDAKMPRLKGRPAVTYGKPLTFERYYDRPKDRFVLRSVTDEIMYEIMMLSGQEYVDEYASKVKAQLAKQGSAPEEPAAKPQPAEPSNLT